MADPPLDLDALDIQVVEDDDPIVPMMTDNIFTADELDDIVTEDTPPESAPRKHWSDQFFGPNEPRARKPKREREKKPPPPKPRAGALVKPLTDMYAALGMMITPFDRPCGTTIIANAEPCAEALDKLARENAAARRVIVAMLETSVWGAVIAAHAPILMAVAAHHVPMIRDGQMPVSSIPSQNGSGMSA